jgi:hypothetical protein
MNYAPIIFWLNKTDDSLTNKINELICKRNKNRYTTKQAIQTDALLSLIKKYYAPLCALSVLSGCTHTKSER